LSVNSQNQKATIKSVKEFGIYNISKYLRTAVKIDVSNNNINDLSTDKKPVLVKLKLFLKLLIDGKSNLYEYTDGNLKRYFYGEEHSNVKQLIFKRYKPKENNIAKKNKYKEKLWIAKNNKFKQQLWSTLKCSSITINRIQKLNYTKSDLLKFFKEYNICSNHKIINYEKKQNKDLFNLTIRPRINSSSLSLKELENYNPWNIDFSNKTRFSFGLEAEFIFSFNKNKRSLIVEPTYQSFRSQKTINVNNVSGGKLITNVKYTSIEIPIGLRHCFFLNKNSTFFVNASIKFDSSSNSTVEFTRNDGSNIYTLEINSPINIALGFGYKYNNKYSLEMRYQTNRQILGKTGYSSSRYKTLSIVFGYTLF
jgi:hypothetical protein